jgi:hypothetical protein
MPRFLDLTVGFLPNSVDQLHYPLGATVVEAFDRLRPISRQTGSETLFAVVVDALHHVAEETQTEVCWAAGLEREKSVDQSLVGVLTLVDKQDWEPPDQQVLHRDLLLDEMRGEFDHLSVAQGVTTSIVARRAVREFLDRAEGPDAVPLGRN